MTKRFLVPISTDHVDFDLNNAFNNATGRLRWNSEEGTLELGMNNDVAQSIGMEFYMPKVLNNSGLDISDGSFVMATGAQGDQITVAAAVTDGSISPEYMIGIATEIIPNGSDTGLIATHGIVRQINTSLWAIGTILYPDPANPGGLTSTKPSAPNIRTPVAIVLRQHESTGRIYVRMTNGSVLGGTDSNVLFNDLQNDDTIVYDSSTNLWKNKQISLVTINIDGGTPNSEYGGTSSIDCGSP